MANLKISTGELCMANRYGQTFADLLKQKIAAFSKANKGAKPDGFDVVTSAGTKPIAGDLEGHLHEAFQKAMGDS